MLVFGDCPFDLGGHRFCSSWPDFTGWIVDVMGGDLLQVARRSRICLSGRYVDYPPRFPHALTAFSPLKAGQGIAVVQILNEPTPWDHLVAIIMKPTYLPRKSRCGIAMIERESVIDQEKLRSLH